MADTNNQSDYLSKLARAKLALGGEAKKEDRKKDTEQLKARLNEAAKAMASDEQKKAWAEAEQAKIDKELAQKRLAGLEEAKKLEDINKKKTLAEEQRLKDEKAEEERKAKIEEILRSQREIEMIKNNPQAGPEPIRTFTRDVSRVIQKDDLTATKIITKMPDTKPAVTGSSRRTWLLGLSLIVVIASVSVGLWTIIQKRVASQALIIVAPHQSLLFADKKNEIALDDMAPEQVLQEIASSTVNFKAGGESVQEVYFTYLVATTTPQGPATTTVEADPLTYNHRLNLGVSDDFLRFLEPQMMLGFYYGYQKAPFYVFKTKNYKYVADALLTDEGQTVGRLLAPFIDNSVAAQIGTGGFQDKMVSNYDTRLKLDGNNNEIALTAWLDKDTLVITTDEAVFAKILNSYSAKI